MTTPAIAEPITAEIKANLKRKFTPNIAGSVMPSHAETPDVKDNPFNFSSSFERTIIAKAADPCAIFDNATIGHKNVLPTLPISCKSTAKNVWCIPVITRGAYKPPYTSPPINGAVLNSHTTASVITFPIANVIGPITIKARNPVTKRATGATTKS